MSRRHVLIGAGPASVSAAQAIREADASADISIVSAEPAGYYSRPGLAYFLARELPEKQLHPISDAEFAADRIGFVCGRASRIDRDAHVVYLADGRTLPYDRLLLATGSRALPLGVPGDDLDGVVKLDDMDDARDLIARAGKAKTAVVVGGGVTALELVEGLLTRGVTVHYLLRKDRYWGNVLSAKESDVVERGLEAQGVRIHRFTEVRQIVGRNGRVRAVECTQGEPIECQLVAVAIGVLPQKELAEAAGLRCARGVLVDATMRTSDPDVFAAGDLAEVCEPGDERGTIEVLWNAAVQKGRVAGLNMVGAAEPAAFDSGCPLNVTRLAGRKITIMGTVGDGEDLDLKGISRGDSQTWREAGSAQVVECDHGDAHLRLVLGEERIQGAVVMGDQSLSFPLQEIIGERWDVGPIMPLLREPGAPAGEIIDRFWLERAPHA